jgi:hypothetical protein
MIKHFILLLAFTGTIAFQSFGQKTLRFINSKLTKVIEVEVGQTLSVQYVAYNNQLFYSKNIITDITDSSITLGTVNDESIAWVQKLTGKYDASYRIIMLKDIVGFRKISQGRTIGKSFLSTGVFVATYIGTLDLFRYNNLGFWPTLGASMAIAFGTTVIGAFILPENPQYKMKDGWLVITHSY